MDPIEIEDASGQLRRLGTIPQNPGFVSAFPAFEDSFAVLEDSQIRDLITDPNRHAGREIFGPNWTLDQKSKGSCNGHAGAEAVMRVNYLRGYECQLLSGAYVYSWINGGRDNGSALEDGMGAIQEHGSCPLNMCPWDHIYRSQISATADAEAIKRRGAKAYAAKTPRGFRSGIAKGFMGVIAVHVGDNYMDLDKNDVPRVDNGPGNHARSVDDLRIIDGVEMFDSIGSWGTSVGNKGRWRYTWDNFAQTFPNHTFYLLPTSNDLADGGSPPVPVAMI
jgi:hypothetical protein